MAFKFIAFATLLATARAGFIGAPAAYAAPAAIQYSAPAYGHAYAAAPAAPLAYAAPIAKAVVAKTVDADYDPNPQYSYAYDVQDSITGDFKNQHETRNGDAVQGSYSLLEADGTRRTVDYTADDVNGFNAVVRKEGVAKVATIATAPAKIAYSQPISVAQPAQLSYAPSAQYSFVQPAQYSYAPAPALAAAPAPSQISYAQPIAKISPAAAHITYAQPIHKYAPAIARYEQALTPIAARDAIPAAPAHSLLAASKYAGPYIAHVAYSSPYISYSH